MMESGDECMEMLNECAEIKIDGGTFIQNLVLNKPLPQQSTPSVKAMKSSQQMIDTLKEHGVDVSYIDPVTFEEHEL
jgi:hypothetical protein